MSTSCTQAVLALALRMESSCLWGGYRDKLQGQMGKQAFPHRFQHWTQEVSLLSVRAVAATTAVSATLSSKPGYPLGSSGPWPALHMLCAQGRYPGQLLMLTCMLSTACYARGLEPVYVATVTWLSPLHRCIFGGPTGLPHKFKYKIIKNFKIISTEC